MPTPEETEQKIRMKMIPLMADIMHLARQLPSYNKDMHENPFCLQDRDLKVEIFQMSPQEKEIYL